MFRILVTGSRNWTNRNLLEQQLYVPFVAYGGGISVIHGDCPTGADKMAHDWCQRYQIIVRRYPADWTTHGRAAGPIRNRIMVETRPDVCLAFIRNNSRGASGCAELAEQYGIRTFRYREI